MGWWVDLKMIKIELTKRNTALITGFSIILMAVAAGYSVGNVFGSLVVADNDNLTTENIINDISLFKTGIIGWVVIFICDLIVSLGVYLLFQENNNKLALSTAWLRFFYTIILGIAISRLIMVSISYENLIYNLNLFNEIWSFGLTIFGLHLICLSYLFYNESVWNKLISLLLILAGIGYLVTYIGELVLPNFGNYKQTIEMIFMAPMILGEIGFAIWLLIKGGKNTFN